MDKTFEEWKKESDARWARIEAEHAAKMEEMRRSFDAYPEDHPIGAVTNNHMVVRQHQHMADEGVRAHMAAVQIHNQMFGM